MASEDKSSQRGTVVFETPLHKFLEIGGMTLSSSVFIKKHTGEEIADIAQENRKFFEPAYWQAVSAIEAEEDQLHKMLPELLVANTAGNSKQEYQVVQQHLPDGSWRWPAYESFAKPRDLEFLRDDVENIGKYTLSDVLTCMTMAQLRAEYKMCVGEKTKSPGKRKEEIANNLFAALTPEQGEALAAKYRNEWIADLNEPWMPDYKEMTSFLCRRISTLMHMAKHRAQLREMPADFPMWEFHADEENPNMPVECKRRNGKKFHQDDPLWDQLPPCDFLECDCRFHPIPAWEK